jgi:Protein of unknown function (DUF3276)
MSEIFSEKVVTNRRTYFFDVKETREGAKYLVIGELTQVGADTERHRVMVFEESLETFVDGLEKAVEFIRSGVAGMSSKEGRQRSEERGRKEVEGHIGEGEIRQILERIERGINEVREHFR